MEAADRNSLALLAVEREAAGQLPDDPNHHIAGHSEGEHRPDETAEAEAHATAPVLLGLVILALTHRFRVPGREASRCG